MSVNLARGASFLGVPLITVRNLLKAWRRGDRSNLWRIAERKNVALDPRTVFVLLEELRDRGLLGPEEQEHGPPEDGLTEAGLALAGADGRRRTPKPQAHRILDQFLDACEAVNARNDLPFDVREVWLFGSIIDATKDDVADVDLSPVYGLTDGYDRAAALRRFREIAEGMGYEAPSFVAGLFGHEAFVQRQLLHGGRRHPLLSMHDTDELRDLGCPCQMVFDASRGGRLQDAPLDRHPSSPGRSNRIGERRTMPDLAATRGPLRPVHAGLLAGDRPSYLMVEATGPWPEDRAEYRLLNRINMPDVMADGVDPAAAKSNALLKRVRFADCDGRGRAGLIITETIRTVPEDWAAPSVRVPRVAVMIERSILQEGSSVTYRFDVVDADHLGRSIDLAQILRLQWWLHVLITADVERILRREIEDGVNFDVTIIIVGSAGKSVAIALAEWTDLFNRPYADEVRERLMSRAPSNSKPRMPNVSGRRFLDRKIRDADPTDDGLDGLTLQAEASGTAD